MDHIIMRNQDLFCTHCGGSHKIVYPISIPAFGALGKSFNKLHGNCKPVWKQPMPNPAWPEFEKALFWWENGERGQSSEAMFNRMSGMDKSVNTVSHPCDPDDFRRCYLLLQFVPEWKLKLYYMRRVSPVWTELVANWAKLTEMYEQNVRENWKNHEKIGMYEFMKSLGC